MIYDDGEKEIEYPNFDSFDTFSEFEEHFGSLLEKIGDLEAFYYYCKNFDPPTILDSNILEEFITEFEDRYRGRYDCEEDYCEETVASCYGSVEPEFIERYIDYSAMARDWFDYGDLIYDNGYVFEQC